MLFIAMFIPILISSLRLAQRNR